MNKIAIIGTGIMGMGITEVLAANGYEVILKSMNNNEKLAISKLEDKLSKRVELEKISLEEKARIIDNISIAYNDDMISKCDIVIEAVVEDIDIKKEVLSYIDLLCDETTIIASNTSSLSITELARCISKPENFIGMHFFNPVNVMELVEVIKGLETSEKTYNTIISLTSSIKKKAVTVNEAPGFVVNRMLIPMINEAINIYAEGIAEKEDIDAAMKLGAKHPMGPLELGDLIGLDVCLNIMDTLYKETGDPKYRASFMLRNYVRVGWLGRKSKKGFYTY